MDLKVSGSSLTQGMKGFSYFWDLFSGVTQACLRPPSDGVGRGVGMQKKYIQRPLFHFKIITMLEIMVICWHRAKIEIFLETLEKLLCTSQVLSHIF